MYLFWNSHFECEEVFAAHCLVVFCLLIEAKGVEKKKGRSLKIDWLGGEGAPCAKKPDLIEIEPIKIRVLGKKNEKQSKCLRFLN